MNILVTGGCGFIGSNFVKYLIGEHPEHKVTVYDALTYCGRLDNLDSVRKKIKIQLADVNDGKKIAAAVKAADIVYHLAAQTHVDNSIIDPEPFMYANFIGTYNVLEAVRKFNRKLVHVSTSEVYGTALTEPMTEEHPLNPMSPYAAAKAGADRLCYSYWTTYKIPVTIIRPFNNYGPNQFTEKLIPNFITLALQDKPLPVYGDGLYYRDWLYVRDTAEALYKAAFAEHCGQAINVGYGKDFCVIEIAKMLLKKLDKPESLIQHVGDRPGNVRRHISSTEKAEKLLGWKAKIDFETGLERTINWYEKNEKWWKKKSKKFK